MENKALTDRLFLMRDDGYKQFSLSLIPGIPGDSVIGVRVPLIKKLAKDIRNTAEAEEFMKLLPHKYHEENYLHAFLINENSDFEKCMLQIEEFLPFVDNWAICDGLRPKCFSKNKLRLPSVLLRMLEAREIYTVRFAIEMLMLHFLDSDFAPEYMYAVSVIQSDDYYVNMMIAWYFATALAMQYDIAVKYLEKRILSSWVHNKTITKAVESRRIDEKTKEYLKTLRVKG